MLGVELLAERGAHWPESSLTRALTRIARHVGWDPELVRRAPIRRAGAPFDLRPFAARRECLGDGWVSLIVIRGVPRGYAAAWCRRQRDGGHVVVAQARRVDRTKPPLVSHRRWWELVLAHELFHVLVPPEIRSGPAHCGDPGCILYPGPDARSVLRVIRTLRLPSDLCGRCATLAASPAGFPDEDAREGGRPGQSQ